MANVIFQWVFLGLCMKGQLMKAAENPYASVIYECLASFPGLLAALLLSGHCWGLRPLLTFCHISSGLTLGLQSLGLYLASHNLALFGHLSTNMFLCCNLASLTHLTALIAPSTSTRGSFCGLFAAFFTLGGIARHLLNLLVISAQYLPTAILALLSILAALAAFFLPETSGLHSMPEKWEDIMEIKKIPRKAFTNFNIPKFNQFL